MKTFSWLYYVNMLLFCIFFLVGALLLDNILDQVNNKKNIFPILIYTNSLDTVEEIIDFIQKSEVCYSHNVIYPDFLESMLIDKYHLTDYKEIAGDYVLPYQVEITVFPLPMKQLALFVNSLITTFKDSIIHYNAKLWDDVDTQASKLRFYFYIMKLILLGLYIFIQFSTRIAFIQKNQNDIRALQKSGIAPGKLNIREFNVNLVFWIIAVATAVIVDFLVNYYDLLPIIIAGFESYKTFEVEKPFIYTYFNIDLLVMLACANLVLVTFQKRMFTRGVRS